MTLHLKFFEKKAKPPKALAYPGQPNGVGIRLGYYILCIFLYLPSSIPVTQDNMNYNMRVERIYKVVRRISRVTGISRVILGLYRESGLGYGWDTGDFGDQV